MPDFEVGMEITTAGSSPDDKPEVGEIRPITHPTGIVLAQYQIDEIWPPVVYGALWRIVGHIVDAPGASHRAKDEVNPKYQNL